MERSAKNIINKYGSIVYISESNDTITTKGIIRPLYYRDKGRAMFNRLPVGLFDNRHSFAILPPDIRLKKTGGEILKCNGEKYRVNANGSYFADDKVIYVWAVLSACTDSVEDDYD